MIFKFLTDQGPRPYMEDRVALKVYYPKNTINKKAWFSVFDGHGGASVAEMCSQKVGELVDQYFDRCKCDVNIYDKVMLAIFKQLDIYAKDHAPHVGATATLVVETVQHIISANCGDSLAMIGYNDNRYTLMTEEHKVGSQKEQERLQKLGATITKAPGDTERINGTLNLARSIGDYHIKQYVAPNPFVSIFKKTKDMRYICMASDGVWDVLSASEIHSIVKAEIIPFPIVTDAVIEQVLQKLIRLARMRGSTDNIAIGVIVFDENNGP